MFGNYYFLVEYSDKLLLQIIKDRGVVEIELISSHIYYKKYIPLEFAIGYVDGKQGVEHEYPYKNINDALKRLFDNTMILDNIIKENLLHSIDNELVE